MTEQATTPRPMTLQQILALTPEERRQRAEAFSALLDQWAAEGDPDGSTDEEWAELMERLENPQLTFRSSVNE